MSTNGTGRFRFGDFEIDVGRRLLRSTLDEEVVPLTPKAFDALQFLVERAGEVVHKAELIDAIWPSVIVEENNLTQAISALRRALGEKPREHRYIATVPGRGYRFVAPAMRPGRKKSSVSGVAQLANLQLISEGPAHQQPCLSPDAGMVAYVSNASGSNQIHVKAIAGGRAQQITFLDGGAGHPAWSSVENGLIYFHDATEGGIYSVGILGTPGPRRVIATGKNPKISSRGARSSNTITYECEGQIMLANADGSGRRPIPGVPDCAWRFHDKWPTLSPDGERVAFFLHEHGPRGDIWSISVSKGELTRLTYDVCEAGPLCWSNDGRHICFSSERRGERALWRIPADGSGDAEPLTSGVGEYRELAISSDDSRIVFTHNEPRARLMAWDPVSGERSALYQGRLKASFPAVSKDGRSIAYFAKTGSFEAERIWLLRLDGESDPVVLTTPAPGEQHIMPRWAHNDEELYFYKAGASWSLDCIRVDGGGIFERFSGFDWNMHKDVAFSPDGDRIAYVQGDPQEPGNQSRRRAVVRDLASGRLTALPAQIVFAPSWSEDSRYVLGTSADGVAICSADGLSCELIVEHNPEVEYHTADPMLGHYAQFSWDQKRIFFTRRTEELLMLELWVVDRDGTNERPLFRYGPVDPLGGRFQVLPGDRILWDEYEIGPAKLWMATITESGN